MAVISFKLTESLDAHLTEQAHLPRLSKSDLVRRAALLSRNDTHHQWAVEKFRLTKTWLTLVSLIGILWTDASISESLGRDLPKEWLRCERDSECTFVTVRGCGGSSPINQKFENDARTTFRLTAAQSDCYETPKSLEDIEPKVGCINNLCSVIKIGQ